MTIVRLSGHPLVRDSLSSPEPGFNNDESGAYVVFGVCKAGSSSCSMCLPDSVRLLHKCCAPWLPRPIMALFHVSYECEKLGYFYILPPSRANEPPIREARI